MRVLAAMSGGVDSAVAAARLVAAGHEVTGVHLALSRNPQSYRSGARGCCSLEDSHDAFRAAERLGIPFYVWDLSEQFHHEVVENFVAEYQAGHTPNPCLRCNEKIKFAAVLERGLALGWDAVATGHYARLTRSAAGEVELRRAVDPGKDQSYVLGVLTADQLAHSLFPLGDSLKSEVRAEAEALGLKVASKPDSHDICFIPDGDTAGWLTDKLGPRPGRIVDSSGETLGTHDGSYRFTVGQRRGLHLGQPSEDGRPRYVLSIEPIENTVVVGSHEDLEATEIVAERPTWTQQPRLGQWAGQAQIRAHGEPVDCTVNADATEVRVQLVSPIRGMAQGQAVVLYDGDRVVGSATISDSGQFASGRPVGSRPVSSAS